MNRFKKFVSALLVLTLMLSVFSACGAKPEPETVPAGTTAAAEAAPAPAAGRADALIEFLEEEVSKLTVIGGVDLHVYGDDVRSADFSVMPESYDLRDRGFVPPVKDQGNWGACWGFASTSAAEISLLSELGVTYEDYEQMMGQPLDLSEKHLAWFANGHLPELEDYPEGEYPYPGLENQAGEGICNSKEEAEGVNVRYSSGGFLTYATGLYASGMGPALETKYPYTAADGSSSTARDWSLPEEARFDISWELENSYILPSPATVNENGEYAYNEYGTYSIKNELLHGRAVSIAYHADQSMDPEARLNILIDNYEAMGVPGTREEFKTFVLFYSFGELTFEDLTAEELAFALKLLLVVQNKMDPDEAVAVVDGLTEEEVSAAFNPQVESEEEAEEEEESEEEEIDYYALAEKLGFDYDEILASMEAEEEAEAEESVPEVYINTETYAQYTDTPLIGVNHAVTIVGWDDHYSAKNFLKDKQPPADGAWIVRNSWGEKYGVDGYFYLSYYDQTICLPESYDFVTSYKAGAPRSVSIVGMDFMTTGFYPSVHTEEASSYGNIFTMDPGENVLRYVSVLCGDLDTEVTADVYLLNEDATVPNDGKLLDRVVKDLRYGGYYRLPLSHDFVIPDGSRIGVVVTQRFNTGDAVKFAVPYALSANLEYYNDLQLLAAGKTSGAAYGIGRIGQGESWIYQDGQWYDWADVIGDLKDTYERANYFSYDNLGIKVYSYPMAELNELHNFDESVSYHGASMSVCSDCSYSVINP